MAQQAKSAVEFFVEHMHFLENIGKAPNAAPIYAPFRF